MFFCLFVTTGHLGSLSTNNYWMPLNDLKCVDGDINKTQIVCLSLIIYSYKSAVPLIVDGVLTPWSNWTLCTVSCGNGTQTRNRSCDFASDVPRGNDCVGDLYNVHPCNTNLCPGIQ